MQWLRFFGKHRSFVFETVFSTDIFTLESQYFELLRGGLCAARAARSPSALKCLFMQAWQPLSGFIAQKGERLSALPRLWLLYNFVWADPFLITVQHCMDQSASDCT